MLQIQQHILPQQLLLEHICAFCSTARVFFSSFCCCLQTSALELNRDNFTKNCWDNTWLLYTNSPYCKCFCFWQKFFEGSNFDSPAAEKKRCEHRLHPPSPGPLLKAAEMMAQVGDNNWWYYMAPLMTSKMQKHVFVDNLGWVSPLILGG